MKKRVLVTGGTGLVGRHLKELMPDAVYVGSKCDLRSMEVARRLVGMGWDRIVHLAAKVGGLVDNMNNQTEYFSQNMSMGLNLLTAAKEEGVPRVTIVASTCAYPDVNSRYPMPEEDLHAGPPPRSNAGYAHAKRALVSFVELVSAENTGLHWNWIAPCNLYGPGDKGGAKGHFVTALLEKLSFAETYQQDHITLMGTGAPMRQFMHAADLARAIKTVCDGDVTESFNCCPSGQLSIREIAETAVKATGLERIRIDFDSSLPDGQFRKDASNWKMMSMPQFEGFKFTPLIEGMRQTYKQNGQYA